jgi:sirohydrochlorin ferrochelatase
MSDFTALLLIAHGSRHAAANDDTHHLADELTRRGPYPAVAAFLELAEPTIDEAASRCVRDGARRIVLLPHFLAAGIHVERDLKQARRRLADRFKDVEFRLAPPLGRHKGLIDLLADRAREAMEEPAEPN